MDLLKLKFTFMKVIKITILLVAPLLFLSCKDEKETPKVRYDSSKTKTEVKADTTQLKVADLPVNFSGTNYLIHPVGDLNIYEKGPKSSFESSRYDGEQSFRVSNNNEYEITGYLQNLKFQQIGSDSIKALSDKPILINTATYLKSIADKTKKQLMVYSLADADTNKDGKVDNDDIKSIYISTLSGENFTKLSTDFQELIDWNIIDYQNRLYFRTIEDINKNGAFDKDDKVHYHYVNLATNDWKVEEYNPIK